MVHCKSYELNISLLYKNFHVTCKMSFVRSLGLKFWLQLVVQYLTRVPAPYLGFAERVLGSCGAAWFKFSALCSSGWDGTGHILLWHTCEPFPCCCDRSLPAVGLCPALRPCLMLSLVSGYQCYRCSLGEIGDTSLTSCLAVSSVTLTQKAIWGFQGSQRSLRLGCGLGTFKVFFISVSSEMAGL